MRYNILKKIALKAINNTDITREANHNPMPNLNPSLIFISTIPCVVYARVYLYVYLYRALFTLN